MSNYTIQLEGAAKDAYIATRFNTPAPAQNAGVIKSLDVYEFRRAFVDYNRADQFSYEGLGALFDLLDDTGAPYPYELDVIGLCCEFTEYSDLDEIKQAYNTVKTIDDLHDRTIAIEFDGGIIIQDF